MLKITGDVSLGYKNVVQDINVLVTPLKRTQNALSLSQRPNTIGDITNDWVQWYECYHCLPDVYFYLKNPITLCQRRTQVNVIQALKD